MKNMIAMLALVITLLAYTPFAQAAPMYKVTIGYNTIEVQVGNVSYEADLSKPEVLASIRVWKGPDMLDYMLGPDGTKTIGTTEGEQKTGFDKEWKKFETAWKKMRESKVSVEVMRAYGAPIVLDDLDYRVANMAAAETGEKLYILESVATDKGKIVRALPTDKFRYAPPADKQFRVATEDGLYVPIVREGGKSYIPLN